MLLKSFALLGAVGVGLGAFGAHALKSSFSATAIESWKTATLYLFVHVLAGLFALSYAQNTKSALCFLIGTVLFSGSLYVMLFTGIRQLGIITPLGGVFFILGWLLLALQIKK